MNLSSSIAIVTGASRGIGRAMAVALAQKGATVVCAARTVEGEQHRGSLQGTVTEIERGGGRALAVPCDITQPREVERLVAEAVRYFGRVDIAVNNAGVYTRGVIASLDPAAWEQGLAVNLTGPFLVCRYVLPGMMERRSGSILNVTSGSARNYDAKHVAYSAAKAGLERLTVNLAEEVRQQGIAVNALDPGLIATEMSRGHGDSPAVVVPPALWILSQEAGTVTGRIFSRREFGVTYG